MTSNIPSGKSGFFFVEGKKMGMVIGDCSASTRKKNLCRKFWAVIQCGKGNIKNETQQTYTRSKVLTHIYMGMYVHTYLYTLEIFT